MTVPFLPTGESEELRARTVTFRTVQNLPIIAPAAPTPPNRKSTVPIAQRRIILVLRDRAMKKTAKQSCYRTLCRRSAIAVHGVLALLSAQRGQRQMCRSARQPIQQGGHFA
ncbi:hypothetical protein [Thalassobius sp. Cn5-15]|uniref:hypothetical protein n=1 Tax=Thalassobius sp. Cn5-15 TaxID=2917763 RepID=UPI001EF162B0|nr:hypothetical protein [Thalassobius sp. Cn5-15]MCG7494478.1 hypothetical protein [Thalassobius sp. Cn5-15]